MNNDTEYLLVKSQVLVMRALEGFLRTVPGVDGYETDMLLHTSGELMDAYPGMRAELYPPDEEEEEQIPDPRTPYQRLRESLHR